MRAQAKKQFDARWKQYEEVIIGQQQSQATLTRNLTTLQKIYEEEKIKVIAAVAAKEEDCQRILTVNEEFHNKKLEEYNEKMEFLLNEFIKNKEAQARNEEVLTQKI